jgi:nucleotide-binding universal stress UspA family protein
MRPVDEIARRIAELERRAAEAGRRPVHVSVYAVPGHRHPAGRCRRRLFDLPTIAAEEAEQMLDELAAVARSFTG